MVQLIILLLLFCGLIGFRVLLSQWTVLCDHDDVFLHSVWVMMTAITESQS